MTRRVVETPFDLGIAALQPYEDDLATGFGHRATKRLDEAIAHGALGGEGEDQPVDSRP